MDSRDINCVPWSGQLWSVTRFLEDNLVEACRELRPCEGGLLPLDGILWKAKEMIPKVCNDRFQFVIDVVKALAVDKVSREKS